MKVLLPAVKAENPLDDEISVTRDTNGFLRPAMGKDSVDAGRIAELTFGTHGFTNLIGGVSLSGEVIEFYEMDVKQKIPSTRQSSTEVVKMRLEELVNMVNSPRTAINIFLNLAVRMYCDLRLP